MKADWNITAADYRALVDQRLKGFLLIDDSDPLSGFAEAIRYSLLAGGKRIRAILALEFCRLCGGDPEKALDVACGIEMLHAYSLIHDDLPCMDNDDLRRGKPTNHIVYGECTATLAGDALQAEAFQMILHSDLPPMARLRCAEALSEAVGFDGMCGGQYLDMLGEGKILSAEELDAINIRKTGALITASCRMGVYAAGGTEKQAEAAAHYGAAIGLAFQIRDDMLDVLSTEAELGKPIGSDQQEQKNTYMAIYGAEVCEERIQKLNQAAKESIRRCFTDTEFLDQMADSLAVRKK